MRVLQQIRQRLNGWVVTRSSRPAARLEALALLLLLLIIGAAGCTSVLVSASNPIPGLTTVAVVPFKNLSAEPSADGRRVALAYFAELQKNPGFQVVPVGIVEQTIVENNLSMGSSADAMELARLLNVDAVVVGAITDYKPYYPPQIGLQVQWYSPRTWVFYPGIPCNATGEEASRSEAKPVGPMMANQPVVRGQSLDEDDSRVVFPESMPAAKSPSRIQKVAGKGGAGSAPSSSSWPTRRRDDMSQAVSSAPRTNAVSAETRKPSPRQTGLTDGNGAPEGPPLGEIKELMSYTRFFDGADPELVKALQAYVLYRSDLRSGGWEAHLHRSDDFLKFTAHRMIVEMLALHGGVLKTQSVFTFWK